LMPEARNAMNDDASTGYVSRHTMSSAYVRGQPSG
jgi:hypothetical protein